MKQFLQEYDMVFAMTAAGCLTIGIKSLVAIIYYGLLRDSEQMKGTANKRLKSITAKVEATYKLHLEMHNVWCMVERYISTMHYAGISLYGWRNTGLYGTAAVSLIYGVDMLGGAYYRMEPVWYLTNSMAAMSVLALMWSSELVLQLRKKDRLLMLQITDYIENSLKPRMEKMYIHTAETRKYQMEYFEDADENADKAIDKHIDLGKNSDDMIPVSKQVASSSEQLQLLEEIMEEYFSER